MAGSVIEAELVEASGFEPTRNYERQDYLAALARVVNDLEENEYDALSVEAQDWFNAAVRALNKKQDLPEFADIEATAEGDVEPEPEEPEGDPTDDNPIDDSSDEEEEPPKKSAKAKAAPVKKKLKVAPEPKDEVAETKKPDLKKKKFPQGFKLVQTEHDYGVNPGSLSHQALVMFEQKDGCRMADVTKKVGGTFYNLLRKLEKEGHLVEKSGDGFITIRHRNTLDRKAKPVKGKG